MTIELRAQNDLLARLRRRYRYEGVQALSLGEFALLGVSEPGGGWPGFGGKDEPAFLQALHDRLQQVLMVEGWGRPALLFYIDAFHDRHRRDAPAGSVRDDQDIAWDDPDEDDVRLWEHFLLRIQHAGDPYEAGPFLEDCRWRAVEAEYPWPGPWLPMAKRPGAEPQGVDGGWLLRGDQQE